MKRENEAIIGRLFGPVEKNGVPTGREAIGRLMDAAREEGRQSAGERVKALEGALSGMIAAFASWRPQTAKQEEAVAAAMAALLSPQAAPAEQKEQKNG